MSTGSAIAGSAQSTLLDTPAPLRIPAILQNPKNASARLIESHNAQQREKLAARKEAKQRGASGLAGKGIGKRVIRRTDNAAFIDNPHIVQPRRADFYPSVPLHPRTPRASFPPTALDRLAPISSVEPRDSDPYSESSQSGAFTTSLKGTRALLRKRGQRAEGVVTRVEKVVRSWLSGEDGQEGGWKVVDPHLVDLEFEDQGISAGLSTSTIPFSGTLIVPPQGRKLPLQHRPTGMLPSLPIEEKQVPAVLELSRSVVHLTLAAADPFDRLVIHLLARYYECLSWSEEHISSPSRPVRLTHLIIPSIARPKPASAHAILTPETTDISDLSGLSSSEEGVSERGTESVTPSEIGDSDAETETERDPDETYRLESEDEAEGYSLHRVDSTSSSAYAASEAESEGSNMSIGNMGDSMTLFPPLPKVGEERPLWVEGDDEVGSGSGVGYGRSVGRGGKREMGLGRSMGEVVGWGDKPTFFEYLYGS